MIDPRPTRAIASPNDERRDHGSMKIQTQHFVERVGRHLEDAAIVVARARDVAARGVDEDVDPAPGAVDLVARADGAASRRARRRRAASRRRRRFGSRRLSPRRDRAGGRGTATRAPAAARPVAMVPPSTPYPPVTSAAFPVRSNELLLTGRVRWTKGSCRTKTMGLPAEWRAAMRDRSHARVVPSCL